MSSDLPADWPAGVGRRIVDEIDSTNAAALRCLPAPGEGPFWLMARRQLAGRGRQGRAWVDPLGNFAASYCATEDLAPAEAGLRSFVAALALFDALAIVTERPDLFALKWPNDVLLNGGKLAGILLETSATAGASSRLCIGFGVNLIAAPDPAVLPVGALAPVSLLAQTGLRVQPEDLLDRLAVAYAAREAVLRHEGFAPIRADWLARAARRGQRVEVQMGKRRLAGLFQDLDGQGALVLVDGMVRHVVPAGDVHFPA